MDSITVSLVLLASTLAGLFIGVWLRSVLPDPHLNADSKEVVKMGTGLVAAVTGLVLGLLTASAKSSYDSQLGNLRQMAANIVLVDRTLSHFGPDGDSSRALLRKTVQSFIDDLWSDAAYDPSRLDEPEFAANVMDFIGSVRQLPVQNESQQTMKSQALQLCLELGKARWQLHRWEDSSIPMPFLVVLNFWLAILFLSFGLFSPRNATVMVVLFVCAVSVAGALFLIVELDQPFAGFVRISSTPLNKALLQI
ncbi:MAG: hypothetical protein JSS02_20670, partial [Planctomycetes bacterium]|nr:hypothetical protein [Planctomycetota bacterium]